MSPEYHPNKRQFQRTSCSLPVKLKFGSQITIDGQIRDISLKSAFIKLKDSVFLQANDEVNFSILRTTNGIEEPVEGAGRISRIAAGEGIAIYFTRLDEAASARLKDLLGVL